MQCPFPGMDPYIERPAIWPDFHDSLITEIRRELQPLLRPKYAALTQDRLYVVESKRAIRPDVSVIEPRGPDTGGSPAAVMAEPDKPMIFELTAEDIREPYIEIIEPAAGNRLITAIEVLSPDNKLAGTGRRKYLRKRREILRGRANLVEIDLLRAGRRTYPLGAEELSQQGPWRYLVSAIRWPKVQEVYAIPLQRRLPRVRIPLTNHDSDVTLDLQAAFSRVWNDGPYPALLHYDGPPPGELTADEAAWCVEQLRAAGLAETMSKPPKNGAPPEKTR